MSSIATVLDFSWAYIRRYWVRLVASILLGFVFAVSNASFIWAVRTLASRWELNEPVEAKPTQIKVSVGGEKTVEAQAPGKAA